VNGKRRSHFGTPQTSVVTRPRMPFAVHPLYRRRVPSRRLRRNAPEAGRGGRGIRANISVFRALEGPAEGALSRLRATETGPRVPFTIIPSAPGGVVLADQSRLAQAAEGHSLGALGEPRLAPPTTSERSARCLC